MNTESEPKHSIQQIDAGDLTLPGDNGVNDLNVPTLDSWYIRKGSLHGFVYNHPSIANGSFIHTNTVVCNSQHFALTQSMSLYRLGSQAN